MWKAIVMTTEELLKLKQQDTEEKNAVESSTI